MAEAILIQQLEASELLGRLDRLEHAVTALHSTPQPVAAAPLSGYLTRRELAKLFRISLVTVHDWTRKGVLTAYKIGNRIYYKSDEVEAAMTRKGGHR